MSGFNMAQPSNSLIFVVARLTKGAINLFAVGLPVIRIFPFQIRMELHSSYEFFNFDILLCHGLLYVADLNFCLCQG